MGNENRGARMRKSGVEVGLGLGVRFINGFITKSYQITRRAYKVTNQNTMLRTV